jgi:hypothetical protein
MLLLVNVSLRISVFLILVLRIGVQRFLVLRKLVLLRRRQLFGWLRKQDLRSAETTAIVSLMSEFLSLHRSWSERMLALEEERVRLERLRLEGAKPLSDAPLGQLRVSEEEQDADWALKQGVISPSEYKSLLETTGLVPSDIEFV